MKKAVKFNQIVEAVISSKLHIEAIFDQVTTQSIQNILMEGSKKFVKDVKTFKGISNTDVKRFSEYISERLNRLPNFLHNHIHFEPAPHTNRRKGALFGEGSHSTFMDIMTVNVNSYLDPKVWHDAFRNKFDLEIKRLRSVIRHEMAHRLDLHKAKQDPIKRMSSRKYRKLMTPHKNSDTYYGMPTEIVAHANHTIELMALDHDRGWKETIALYALSDQTRNFKNTKRFISTVAKLMVEYDIPWTKRRELKRELLKLARQMKASVKDLGLEEVDKALDIALDSVTPGTSKSVRFLSQYTRGSS